MPEGYTKNTMLFIPMETPVLENLNSYYLNIERLIEHCQGALGPGGIHLKSATAKGVIESVSELSEELGMRHLMTGHLSRWTKKYSREIKQFDIEV